ncbi:MAG: alanine--tRNA ligase [Oscillospiraceae bacterium]|nr:alanine--tRNA ligase [Oscillospiraceae bacterium]
MAFIGLNDLRERYLAFFESKGHLRAPSASLVPQGDNSLLLINSGMAPLKKYFTGEVQPPSRRMTTCQKCVRTPDIESVGVKDRYGTFFEMFGNFSFGDYFKREAIAWAYEFMTEALDIPLELLYFSVFEQDDEAWDIWTKEIGVPESHMVRMGREDNFWEHGKGPCGPCSEIYYDRGKKFGCDSADCKVGCDCDRYVEVWNLVFTQFNNDGEGNYTELASKNIDTGGGLERLACALQGVGNLFEVDTMQAILQHVCRIAGVTYKTSEKTDISLRIITDHVRSTTMMIGDGVLPSNEGRGYVMRRLLRRAARHGRLLGINRPFLSEIATTVIAENAGAYPELVDKQEFILKVIATEEETFARTIDAGMKLLDEMIAACRGGNLPPANANSACENHGRLIAAPTLAAEDTFKLADTFGFPIDLTREIAAEHGLAIDEDGYQQLVKEAREKSRAGRKATEGWENAEAQANGNPEGEFFANPENQSRSAKNHTAAHLLQAALREILGTHVEQAGQAITPEGVRFDFTHFSALTGEELTRVETRVNEIIEQAIDITVEEMPLEQARAAGAMALFGEKYGDVVRVVSIGDFSKELCGGTHAANTRDLGLFVIEKESSVSAGARRIEAYARAPYAEYAKLRAQLAQDMHEAQAKLKATQKDLERKLAAAQEQLSQAAVQSLIANATQIGGVRFVCGEVAGDVRGACDAARAQGDDVVALFAAKTDKGTLQFAACAGPAAVKAGAHAGNLVKAAAQAAGGSGGGKPDSAMAGGKVPAKLAEALEAGEAALQMMM